MITFLRKSPYVLVLAAAAWLAGWLAAACLAACLAASCSLVGWLAGWLLLLAWLAGCLLAAAWLAGCWLLPARLAGWLAGCCLPTTLELSDRRFTLPRRSCRIVNSLYSFQLTDCRFALQPSSCRILDLNTFLVEPSVPSPVTWYSSVFSLAFPVLPWPPITAPGAPSCFSPRGPFLRSSSKLRDGGPGGRATRALNKLKAHRLHKEL